MKGIFYLCLVINLIMLFIFKFKILCYSLLLLLGMTIFPINSLSRGDLS